MPFISFCVLKSKGLIFNEHFRFPETFHYLQLNTVQKKAENATFGALHYAEIACTPVDDTGNNMLAKTPRKGFWGGLGGWQKSFIGHLFWYWGNLQMRDPPMSKQHTNHMTVETSFNDIWSFTPVFVLVEQWSVIHCGPLCFIACLSLLDSHCTGYHYSWQVFTIWAQTGVCTQSDFQVQNLQLHTFFPSQMLAEITWWKSPRSTKQDSDLFSSEWRKKSGVTTWSSPVCPAEFWTGENITLRRKPNPAMSIFPLAVWPHPNTGPIVMRARVCNLVP